MSKRLDQILVDLALVRSRAQANELIKEKKVEFFDGEVWKVQNKPGLKLDGSFSVESFRILETSLSKYVSRGGAKLESAIAKTDLHVQGKVVLDIGVSTGGFTDCLLQHGAALALGLDVGKGQLSKAIDRDQRFIHIEGVNARELSPEIFPPGFLEKLNLVVVDVSFISLRLIFPALSRCLHPGVELLALVKPQFEVGAENLGKGGLVKDKALYPSVRSDIHLEAEKSGFRPMDYFPSAVEGGDGNQEFFLYAKKV